MSAAPLIPYALIPARWGVTILREPHLLCITIPPLPSWRLVHRGYWIAAAIFLAIFLSYAIDPRQRTNDSHHLAFPLAIYGSAFLAVVAKAWHRMRRWLTFTITAEHFTITKGAGQRIGRSRSWPRRHIHSAHRNVSSGQCVIRIAGQDLLDVYISPSREVVEFVCQQIEEGLRAEFITTNPTKPTEPRPAKPLAPATKPATRPSLIVSVIASIVLTGALLLVLIFPPLLYFLIIAAIPAGLYFGTQKKDYWM